MNEYAVTFDCHGNELMGIVHVGSRTSDVAVVIVVGGPQYRVGSHRMFVELARALAAAGIPVLRFDCRGMGDSDGEFTSFEDLSDDIRASVDAALRSIGVHYVVLVGLCDGASAIAMYAQQDSRIAGMVLMNPWVRSTQSEAAARVSHYYGGRLRQWAFWRRLLSGEVRVFDSLAALLSNLRLATVRRDGPETSYIDRMLDGVAEFDNGVLVLLSADDLTAQEFAALIETSAEWRRVVDRPNLALSTIQGADHTFSEEGAIEDVAQRIVRFASPLLERATR